MTRVTTPAGDGGGRSVSAPRPILALDLGASRIRAAVVLPDGALAARADGITRSADGPATVLADAIALLRAVREQVPASQGRFIAAVGICAPGPVDPHRGWLIEPPNLGPAFRDVPFAEPIATALGMPAVLERDTNVALLGELAHGAAVGARDALYLTVSTGLGGAIVTDGRLLGGPDGVAGELGHILVSLDGPLCGCGARGHLEALSSGVAIARMAREAIAAGSATGLADLERRQGAALTARDVATAEDAGDPEAARIMDVARNAFAAAVVGLVDTFAPEVIVIGGSIARAQGERWLGPTRAAVARDAFRIPAARVRIVPAALGDDVGLVGALALVSARLG
jgi:glucokinase